MTERIVFLDRASVDATLRRPTFNHIWEDHPETAPDQVLGRLAQATIAISNKVVLRAPVLEKLPQLKMIAAAATGTDNIDIDYCCEHGIRVCNIRNYALHAVPEHVFMLILALRRNLLAYQEDVRNGRWQKSDKFCLFTHPIHDLFGSTLGIIGFGGLGQAVKKLGEAFGMRILVAEHKNETSIRPGFVAFDAVLREADVVTLHMPLTDATRHIISVREFDIMRSDALLINTARGGLVDETALFTALKNNVIGGAGFDVLAKEPPVDGHPLLDLNSPNFIVTPHVAWASSGAMQILADQLVDNIEAFVAGRPQNTVI